VTAELAAQLQRTVLSLESALKKIKQAEAVLNKTDAVTTGALMYSTHKSVRLEQKCISLFCNMFFSLLPPALPMGFSRLFLNLYYVAIFCYIGIIGKRSAHCNSAESPL